jgi:OOP family OmpA-OmpF porin
MFVRMTMRMLAVFAAACILNFSVAVTAIAQGYVGGNIGQGRISYDSGNLASDLAAAGITGSGTVSDTDLGFKLFGGYQFNENLAVEAGYFHLSRFDVNGNFTKPKPAGTFTGTIEGQGPYLDAVGTLPFGKGFSGIGRAGIAYFQTKASATASSVGLTGYSNATADRIVGEFGLGLQYDFTKLLAGRLEFQRYFNVGDIRTGSGDVDLYSVGLVYKF